MKSILLVKKFLGLVEMMSGLVNASFSLPEWQAVKMIFFAPCYYVYFVFPQGTQSANPHNDYCQHFVDTGQRPHNFIRDVG